MAWWIFQNVAITTVLAVAVTLVCRAGRIGPVARHALWVLVLVKFVTPPLIVWPWAAPDPFGIATIDARAGDRQAGLALINEPPAMAASDGDVAGRDRADGTAPGDRRDRTVAGIGATAWPWFLGVWAAGSLCLLGLEAVRLARLARRVRAAAPTDAAIVSRVAAVSARLGLRPVPVVTMAGSASPVVWGLGRPRLLWPATLPPESTDASIDGLLVHELAHVKRGDHLVGWIELAAGVVWWWNPLFWFVRSALREQAELACDAWVISALPNGRRAYAESLLALSCAAVPATPSMAAVGVRATNRRVLERRLVMIMKGRAPLRLPIAGLFSLALVAAATLPAWATASQQQTPPPPTPPVTVVKQTPAPPPAKPAAATRARTTVVRQAVRPPVTVQVTPVRKDQTVVLPSRTLLVQSSKLPADGQQLLEGFDTDSKAIQEEADRKLEARRAAAVKALEDLQAQYTKAGKLDEAVAIRDYLRAGGPGQIHRGFIRRKG